MLKLYNTRTKQKENFIPLHDNTVNMYACGPTVYDFVHIGNFRTFIFEDLVYRTLKYYNYDVTYIMNITDVGHLTDDADTGDDKMEKGAAREGKSAWDIAAFYTAAFQTDSEKLNILPPTTYTKATEHIAEQIDQVQKLIDGGYTYETPDGIYFDTTKIDDYGKLSDVYDQQLAAGVRVEMGYKKNPHDFAVWKFTRPEETRQMEWDAFGKKGFPGWHIECSAMSMKYLGDQFDIHCGGIDLIPVHHTNEIAQAESITHKKPWVSFWLHGEFINVNDEKMSKSKNNFLTVAKLEADNFNPLAYRYLTLQTHYRKQMNFSYEGLHAAQKGLHNLYATVKKLNGPTATSAPNDWKQAFETAIADDLNMPKAVAVLWEMLKSTIPNSEKLLLVKEFDTILGLDIIKNANAHIEIPEEIQKILETRQAARAAKDWETSDKLRTQINELGFEIEDTDDGPILSPRI